MASRHVNEWLRVVDENIWIINEQLYVSRVALNCVEGYAVFDERSPSTEIQKYCVQDVTHMPALRDLYRAKLCDVWWRKIEAETIARIDLSQGRNLNGQGSSRLGTFQAQFDGEIITYLTDTPSRLGNDITSDRPRCDLSPRQCHDGHGFRSPH